MSVRQQLLKALAVQAARAEPNEDIDLVDWLREEEGGEGFTLKGVRIQMTVSDIHLTDREREQVAAAIPRIIELREYDRTEAGWVPEGLTWPTVKDFPEESDA